jgi:hypothetical protein
MSLYGDAIAAIRSVILIDERVKSQSQRLDRMADEIVALKERVIRLEAIIEVALQSRPAPRRRPVITDDRG